MRLITSPSGLLFAAEALLARRARAQTDFITTKELLLLLLGEEASLCRTES
jgi:hypothetical protein